MGKIADALERHNKEKSRQIEFLADIKPQKSASENREISLARDYCTTHECSSKVLGLSAPESSDAENFRLLRAQVLFAGNRKRPRTIMVTSPFPGEGKTFVAVNLAVSIALGIDEQVLLVDCDLRRPQVHETLGYLNSEGLHDHLTRKKKWQELTIQTQIDKLSMLPAGKLPSNPTELLSSSAMRAFLEEVKKQSRDRFIVIDSPPSEGPAETNVLAKYVDAIILVVMAQKTPRDSIQKSIQALGKDKILGIVFNGFNPARKNYYKYYERYYKGK